MNHKINSVRLSWVLFLSITAAVLISSCKKDPTTEDPTIAFDRKKMLANYANNLIVPSFTEFQTRINELKSATDNFISEVNETNLIALQEKWDAAYSSWMFATAYSFGPAGEYGIRMPLDMEIGVWPANIAAIESNIAQNKTTLSDFNRDNRGLNAVDYLIFDLDNNNSNIINAFTADEYRGNYLAAVVNKIKSQVDDVVNEWNNGYTETFINNDGTSVGSSCGQFYNQFVQSFESIKNFRLGIPLGKLAGQTQTEPSKVEARYSKKSLKYIRLSFDAIEAIWYGKDRNGNDGIGWKEYLESATGGQTLITNTEAQLAVIHAALDAIPDNPSLEEQIIANPEQLNNLQEKFQQHVRYFKSDMSSLLGIAITFSSNDGD